MFPLVHGGVIFLNKFPRKKKIMEEEIETWERMDLQ